MMRRLILLAALGALALGACGTDDDTEPTGTAPTTVPTETSPTTAPEPTEVAIWPAPGEDPFASAEDAALDFARAFLGMPDASVSDEATDGTDTVGIRPYEDRGPTTFVQVAEQDGGWVVLGARSDQIVVDDPVPGAPPDSPLAVRGESTAFEGTIHLELRALGSTEAIVFEFTTGGAQGEMGPFDTVLAFDEDLSQAVLVVFQPDASDQASMLEATVLLLGA